MSSKESRRKRNLLKIPLIIIGILCPLIMWLGFGDQGLFKLYRTEMERQAYIERIRRLTDENKALLEEIARLRSDMKYVESIARKNFNMLKQNEVLYRFEDSEKLNENEPAGLIHFKKSSKSDSTKGGR